MKVFKALKQRSDMSAAGPGGVGWVEQRAGGGEELESSF